MINIMDGVIIVYYYTILYQVQLELVEHIPYVLLLAIL